MNPPQSEAVVLYEVRGGVALITMNRPQYANAQNSKMTYALDASFRRAVDDFVKRERAGIEHEMDSLSELSPFKRSNQSP